LASSVAMNYTSLVPVASIIWLGKNLTKSEQFHSVFHLSEDTTRERFSDDIELHTLELKKLHLLSKTSNPRLYYWSRFLVAQSEEEFEQLAKTRSRSARPPPHDGR
jgi:hypothetical protein